MEKKEEKRRKKVSIYFTFISPPKVGEKEPN
jgi:hypothetical protein